MWLKKKNIPPNGDNDQSQEDELPRLNNDGGITIVNKDQFATEKEFALMQTDRMLLLNLTVKEKILHAVKFEDPHLMWDIWRPFTTVTVCTTSLCNCIPFTISMPKWTLPNHWDTLRSWARKSAKPLESIQGVHCLVHSIMRSFQTNLILSALVPHNPLLVDILMSN